MGCGGMLPPQKIRFFGIYSEMTSEAISDCSSRFINTKTTVAIVHVCCRIKFQGGGLGHEGVGKGVYSHSGP